MDTSTVPEVPLQAKLTALCSPGFYQEGGTSVEVIETHCAWIFLTKTHAYKLKKPMLLDRMDNRRLSARQHNCAEELRLNRRLAPDVYLDVVALHSDAAGRLSLGGPGTVVEWLVKMRRLPRALLLDQALAAGTATPRLVEPVCRLLANFYCREPSVSMPGEAYCRRLEQEIEVNGQALAQTDLGFPNGLIDAAITAQRKLLKDQWQMLASRADAGRIIEAHGDLKPEHIYLGEPPCVIDCLEFDRDLRLLDPLEELAFFTLECEKLGASWIGRQALAAYLDASADEASESLFGFYLSRRAARRALTAAWHLRDPSVRERRDWRAVADDYLCRALAA